MKRLSVLLTICFFGTFALNVAFAASETDDIKYVQADELMLLGKGFDNAAVKYGRLPADVSFRESLVELSTQSAGIAVRFATDSKRIAVRWTLTGNNSMNHMPSTGIKGLDLYSLEDKQWYYRGTAVPAGKNTATFFSNTDLYPPIVSNDGKMKDYIAYLPLYDGVESLEIGVEKDAVIGAPVSNNLTTNKTARPIVFYGTSITQGGCASRPGMAYPAILGRKLNRETINLGFSGNAQLDLSVAQAIGKIDAEAVVIDCLPNCSDKTVNDNAYPFISYLAKNKPDMKIFMVEYPLRPAWEKVYHQLTDDGFSNIVYIKAEKFLGEDREATVDGLHFTDLGFYRFANALFPFLKELQILSSGNEKTVVTQEHLQPMHQTPEIRYTEISNKKSGEDFKILVFGNSLSFHGRSEPIGWFPVDCGMAASSADKDYVHQLLQMIDEIMPNKRITVRILPSLKFERNFASFDPSQYEKLLSSWRPDLTIFQLGENVPFNEENTPEIFTKKYTELLEYFKTHGSPVVICTTSFFPSRQLNDATQKAATSSKCFIVDLSHLTLLDNENFAKDEKNYPGDKTVWKVGGIGLHPGDLGMKNIAKEIFVIVNAVWEEKR